MAYRPTIGLEIHAELSTETKMFCACRNNPDEAEPNVNVCPVCLAHPGTLPVPNREAIRHVLRVGSALGATLADFSEFDRKSYFYPDIPKGYQISQYEFPLVKGGELAGVVITRVHLEEDTARSSHEGESSRVDFNRAGVPLMELVTEPVIHDAQTAGAFARELQLLFRTLGASEANLEKGEMRVEANISVSETDAFGTKVEVKNLNSFRSVERAIEYEIERQSKVLSEGGTLLQETRGWDENAGRTFSQRLKEGSADYRYFAEPDIPKLILSEIPDFSPEVIRASLPELPAARKERYVHDYGMKEADAAFVAADTTRALYLDEVLSRLVDTKARVLAINYFVSDLKGEPGKASVEAVATLMEMIVADKLSSRGGKDVLAALKESGGDPVKLADEMGLMQVSDPGALTSAIESVLKEHAGVFEEYKAGKEASLQFLVGQGMKATKGAGNPSVIRDLIVTIAGK